MNIVNERKNSLLHRQELILTVEGNSTPSNAEIIKKLSEQTKKPEENIIIEKISSGFGNKTFTIKANVYEDAESRNKYVTISKKERKKVAEAEKKAKEEAEKAKTEEVKVEEKKEEVANVEIDKKVESSESKVGDSNDSKKEEVSKEPEAKE